jgi:hypothetical protein
MNSELAVYHRVRIYTDSRRADGMAEAGRSGPCEIDQVLSASSFRTRDDLGIANAVEGGLTAQFPSRLDRLHDGFQIVIGT